MHMVVANQFIFFHIAKDSDNGIQLMKEAWFYESVSIDRRIDLHLIYQVARATISGSM